LVGNLGIEGSAKNLDMPKDYCLFLKIQEILKNPESQDIVFFPFYAPFN
jgi:hypothetical protein